MPFQQGNTRARKLTADDVLAIREKYLVIGGYTYSMLSIEYGVSNNTIKDIVKGNSWQRIAGHELVRLDKPPADRCVGISDNEINASQTRLAAMLDTQTKLGIAPSLYNDPPPTDAEDNRAGSLGLSKLRRELDGPRPERLPEVSDELDKLEKGDS
jgi:hypothetical protein